MTEHNFLSAIKTLLLTTIWKTSVPKYFLRSDVPLLSRTESQWSCTINSCGRWTVSLHRRYNQYLTLSFVLRRYRWKLSLCFLNAFYLCTFCNPHRKRSSTFISLTPLFYTLLLCSLSTNEWFLHVHFKLLFPASITVLLCHIYLTCCISDTKSLFCRSLNSVQSYKGFHVPVSVLKI
jgi:hypothetical protein